MTEMRSAPAPIGSGAGRRGPARAVGLLFAALAAACGGGGGGGGGGGDGGGNDAAALDPATTFFLQKYAFARPIFDVDGELDDLKNPSSLYEVDPLTGVPLPGFPKTLQPGVALDALAVVNLQQLIDPFSPEIPVVPRNAALVLEFTRDVEIASLALSGAADAGGSDPGFLTSSSPIQVRRKDGGLVPVRAFVKGARVVLSAVTSTEVGWEASPLVFDPNGNVQQDPKGLLKIVMGPGVGAGNIEAVTGEPYTPRLDLLGSLSRPLPFNPGNSLLDAIELQTADALIKFNGFLPDLTPPRIIRPVRRGGTITAIGFGPSGEVRVVDAAAASDPPNLTASGGKGEWAGSVLEITTDFGAGNEVTTSYLVDLNGELTPGGAPYFQLRPGEALDPIVGTGIAADEYLVRRAEYFEPIPGPLPPLGPLRNAVTVDPVNKKRDPNNPEEIHNSDLRYFLRVFDEAGTTERTDVWDPSIGKFEAIPPRSILRMEFSERMDGVSFRPYESFYVVDDFGDDDEPLFDRHRIGRNTLSEDARTVSFEPFLEDQFFPGDSEFIGFGGTASNLKLVLRTRPEPGDIASLLGSASSQVLEGLVEDLDEVGVRGVTDLGGRGLGLPKALLDQSNIDHFVLLPTSPAAGPFPPAIDFKLRFKTSQLPSDKDYGAIVHRFMGQAQTGSFTTTSAAFNDPVKTGIEYHDFPPIDTNDDGEPERRFLYGPLLQDAGLSLPGRLTGSAARSIQHVLDNFNDPQPTPYTSAQAPDKLPNLGFGSTLPLNSPFGCRFQHIYRAGDASPSVSDFEGVVLDLVGLAWSPVADLVTSSSINDIEILIGLSSSNGGQGPNTTNQGGIPNNPNALIRHFDCNMLEHSSECGVILNSELQPFAQGQPKRTVVVKKGTPYPIAQGNLIRPLNALFLTSGFNRYHPFPAFNAGVDQFFPDNTSVKGFPYDSRFALLIEYVVAPQAEPPSNNNFIRFAPGLLSSALPRFRVWSQGQSPLANCVPNTAVGVNSKLLAATGFPGFNGNYYRGGEGGPLIDPATFTSTINPPNPNNAMPAIGPPPVFPATPTQQLATYLPNFVFGDNTLNAAGGIASTATRPKCNTSPYMNWYFANGMLAYPLPHTLFGVPAPGLFNGPTGNPPTPFVGYQPCFTDNPLGFSCTEPGMAGTPGEFGGNERYFMLFNYFKRVSQIESPAIQARMGPANKVRYRRPILEPPLSAVDPAARLGLTVRASALLDFSAPQGASAYVDPINPDFENAVSATQSNRPFVKFRAVFSIAPGQSQPPFLETVVLPYERVAETF